MRRTFSLVVAAVLAVGLAACAPAAGAPVDDCTTADVPLADLDLAADPRQATGPSTACLTSLGIDAVDLDTPASLPVTVTDAEGRSVEVTDASRILPLDISGTIAATVFALGLGDAVVGRDAATQFAGTAELPVVTNAGHTLNAEAILQLDPSIVLTDTSIGPKEVRQQLRDAGIAVVVVSSERSLATVDDLIAEIAGALGVPARGEALSHRVDADLAAAADEIASVVSDDPADRPRMLFLYVRGNANVYYIFGADSGADALIDAVGGVDVATEIGWEGMRPMTAEALVAASPDVLVMMTDGLASVGGVDGLLERIPALAQTPAGAHRRVVDMADADILSFGPRSAEIVRALARAVYAPGSSAEPAPESGP
jgi:iron complex transport system substrate-binding protein